MFGSVTVYRHQLLALRIALGLRALFAGNSRVLRLESLRRYRPQSARHERMSASLSSRRVTAGHSAGCPSVGLRGALCPARLFPCLSGKPITAFRLPWHGWSLLCRDWGKRACDGCSPRNRVRRLLKLRGPASGREDENLIARIWFTKCTSAPASLMPTPILLSSMPEH